MKISAISTIAGCLLGLASLLLSGCDTAADSHEVSHSEQGEGESLEHKILATSPVRKDVVSTQQYVCQIHSCQHIEIRALEGGYLEQICVKEGQAVKKGELMFKILPTLYQAKLESEEAEVQKIKIELENAQALLKKSYVAAPEVALKKAELAKAKAKLALAEAELGFTSVTAPFDGIVDRQHNQLGSLIEEGDVLTTFSDNSTMWVYFNVPEKDYLAYKADLDSEKDGDGHAHRDRAEIGQRPDLSAQGKDRCDRSRLQQHDRQHLLPGRLPQSGWPAALRSDRHHLDPPHYEGRRRHPSAGDL